MSDYQDINVLKSIYTEYPDKIYQKYDIIMWNAALMNNMEIVRWISELPIPQFDPELYGIIGKELYILKSNDLKYNEMIIWFVQHDKFNVFDNDTTDWPYRFLEGRHYNQLTYIQNIDLIMALDRMNKCKDKLFIYLICAVKFNYLEYNLSIDQMEWVCKIMRHTPKKNIILSHANPNTYGYWFRKGYCTDTDQYREYKEIYEIINEKFINEIAYLIISFI